MASIDSLCKSFLDMDMEEKTTLIRRIREARRQLPAAPKKHTNGKAKGTRSASATINGSGKGTNSKIDPMTLLKSMSQEERARLLKELGII